MNLHLGTLGRLYSAILPLDDADFEVVAGAVSAWRHWINKELPYALDWDESPTAPFEDAAVGEADWELVVASEAEQVTKPDLWLPGDHDFLFIAQDLAERWIWVGSSAELLRELEQRADAHETMLRLARRSLKFRLPLARMP